MKIFLIFAFFICLIFGGGFLFLYGFETIANYTPTSVSVGFFFFGLFSYLIGKILLRKKHVYHRESSEQIRLDTSLYADYSYIIGIICMILGVVTFQPLMSGLSKAWILFSIFALIAVYKLYIMVTRLRHAIHDKIVINSNWIQLDDPESSNSNTYNRESINKIIISGKMFPVGYGNNSEFRYQKSILFNIVTKEGEKPNIIKLEPEKMNLKVEYIIDALKEMNYDLTLISENEWEGHVF